MISIRIWAKGLKEEHIILKENENDLLIRRKKPGVTMSLRVYDSVWSNDSCGDQETNTSVAVGPMLMCRM